MKIQLVLLILVGFLGLTVALPLEATADEFPEVKSTQQDSNVVDDVSAKFDWHIVYDFEDSKMPGWTRTGTAFNNQPTFGDNPTARNRGQPAKQHGNGWIGGFENQPNPSSKPTGAIQGDGPQGTLTSPPFKIGGNQMRFLIGGGCDMKTERLELLIGHVVVKKETGKCTETMERKYWDVHRHVGKTARLRLVDKSSGGWGHINFDCFEMLVPIEWQVLSDFEHGQHDWTVKGMAFKNQPTYGDNPTARHRGQPAKQQGKWWIGTFENRPSCEDTPGAIQGDGPQGSMISPPFKIRGNKLSFLIGGGCDIKTERAELLIGDKTVVATATGKCHETMETKYWNVGNYLGMYAQVRLIDGSSGGWGHINFDFLTMAVPVAWDVIFDFEHGIDRTRWILTGTAFNNQPTYEDNPTARNRGQPARQHGHWWIGGYEDRSSPKGKAGAIQGDVPKGTLTSPEFIINGRTLSFLIGGGCDMKTERVELLIGNEVVDKATGKCTETMEMQYWDVRKYIGRSARIRLVDNSSGGWGHINFDHLAMIW